MIKHVFFDLDHTLWDFESNAEVCLKQIHAVHLENKLTFENFIGTFRVVNRQMWRALESKEITHEELRRLRFQKALEQVNINCSIDHSLQMNDLFLELLPTQNLLMPGASETLVYLAAKYQLHIISNGYYDIQIKKMANSNIDVFFNHIITGDLADARKPDIKIFDFALNKANASRMDSVYIGDDEIADKVGAANAQIPYIHYDIHAKNNTNTEISELVQLKKIL